MSCSKISGKQLLSTSTMFLKVEVIPGRAEALQKNFKLSSDAVTQPADCFPIHPSHMKNSGYLVLLLPPSFMLQSHLPTSHTLTSRGVKRDFFKSRCTRAIKESTPQFREFRVMCCFCTEFMFFRAHRVTNNPWVFTVISYACTHTSTLLLRIHR